MANNGQYQISGLQTGLPGGGQQSIGPYVVPCSDVQCSNTLTVTETNAIGVPTGAGGVIVTTPVGGTVAVTVSTSNTDVGININPGGFGIAIEFDPGNVPAGIYFTATDTTEVFIQFT